MDVIHAGLLTVMYLRKTDPDFASSGKKAYVIGQGGIPKELAEVGIPFVTDETDLLPPGFTQGDPAAVGDLVSGLDPAVGCVMVGFDPNLTYPKIFKAMNYLQREGALFLVR